MRAEVIAIGDEIITGQRLDTNSQWLSTHLTDLGVNVAFHTTIGDDLADSVAAFQTACQRVDLVVATGGLGPTADDLTRQAIAEAFSLPLERNEQALGHIEHLFASRGREMPESNRLQADFPEGSQPIRNDHGTAPGIELTIERPDRGACVLFALPGVPAEMHEMWRHTVAPRLGQLSPKHRLIRQRRLKCFGVGESKLEAMLPDLIRRGREPKVGITVSDATITLRITATGTDDATCRQAIAETENTIREKLGTLVFGVEDDELEDIVLRMLAERGRTLAVVEWATAGRLSQLLLATEKASGLVLNSQVIASREQLDALLGSPLPDDVSPHDAEAAVRLAERIRLCTGADYPPSLLTHGADYGLAVAAYPPDPFQAEARVCVAIASLEGTRNRSFGCASHPAILQTRTAKQALNALRLELLDHPDIIV